MKVITVEYVQTKAARYVEAVAREYTFRFVRPDGMWIDSCIPMESVKRPDVLRRWTLQTKATLLALD